jgi:hypothetical protein
VTKIPTHKGPDLTDRDPIAPSFDLHLDSSSFNSKRILVGNDVDTTIWTWWRLPGDVIAHSLQEASYELLKVVRVEPR